MSDVIITALIVSFVSPVVLLLITNAQSRRREQRQWTREDTVALKAKADESLKLLGTIHTLVNSNMTAAIQSELDETSRALVLMREIVELHRLAGNEPSSDTLAEIDVQVAKIADLKVALEDRAVADEEVKQQQASA